MAVALEAGDQCRALAEAQRLQEETIAAINARRVPAPFQEPLTARVNELVARIECIPPAPIDDEGKSDENGKGRGKGKTKGKNKDKKKGDD